MKKMFIRPFIGILFTGLIISPGFSGSANAQREITTSSAPDEEQSELSRSIAERNKQLDEINNQIKQTHSNLEVLNTQKRTLSNELKKINYTINQVELSIKSSEINLSKLALELQELNEQSEYVAESVEEKKVAVGRAIVLLSREDKNTWLTTFLRSESLVKGAFEAQALLSVQNKLSADIKELNILDDRLEQTIIAKAAKRKQVEAEAQNLKVRKSIALTEKNERSTILVETKNKEQLYQSQLDTLQKLQEEIAQEIEKMEAALRGQIDADHIPPARPGTIANPVPGGIVSQGYGRTSFARHTYKSKWHNGYDFAKFLGAEIVSAEDGRVIAVGNQDKYCPRGAYGKFIVVKHFNGLTTLYAHLSAQNVAVGQEVARGEVIGYMGKSGWATGPHLHFTVYDSSTYKLQPSRTCGPMPVGGDINPGNYLPNL